jgi:hypothetical protein
VAAGNGGDNDAEARAKRWANVRGGAAMLQCKVRRKMNEHEKPAENKGGQQYSAHTKSPINLRKSCQRQ